MALQASQTCRGRLSPGGTFSVTGAPQSEQNFIARVSPQSRGQVGERAELVIGSEAKFVARRARAVHPERPETKRLRAGRIPAVRGHEADRRGGRAEAVDGELVDLRRWLVDPQLVD